MSENMEEQEPSAQSPASEAQETENHAPRVARSASSQPLIGAEQVRAHEGAVKSVQGKSRRGAPRARRMSLSLTRIDAWSAAKVSFMLSIAGGIIQIVAAALLWMMLNVVGVFDADCVLHWFGCRWIRPGQRAVTEHGAECGHHLLDHRGDTDYRAGDHRHVAVQRGEHTGGRHPRDFG